MGRALVAGISAALLAFSGAGLAHAQDAEAEAEPVSPVVDEGAQERARLHFEAGASYYEAASYEDALREFRRAYDLSQRPALFYNFSLCYQNLDDYENAVTYLRRYLEEVEEIPNRANLELRLRSFEERRDAQAAQAAAGGGAEGSDPGEGAQGSSGGDTSAPPSGGGDSLNVGAILGFSVAAVGVVMVAAFGGLTLAENASLKNQCSPNCTDAEVGTLRTFALLTDIGFGVALAGAAAGLILLLVGDGGGDGGSESVSFAPWTDGQSGGLSLRGSF